MKGKEIQLMVDCEGSDYAEIVGLKVIVRCSTCGHSWQATVQGTTPSKGWDVCVNCARAARAQHDRDGGLLEVSSRTAYRG